MLKDLLFDDCFKNVVLNSEKQTTSRLTTTLMKYDTFVYEDTDFVVTNVEMKKIKDVDFVSESFQSTQELVDKLVEIYVTRLHRRESISEDDTMFVISFQRVDTQRNSVDVKRHVMSVNTYVSQVYIDRLIDKMLDREDRYSK